MITVDKYLLFDLLIMLLSRLPMLLLLFGATIWAIVRRKLHPQASLMVLMASLIYLLAGPFFTVFFDDLRRLDVSAKTYRWLYSGTSFFGNFVLAAIIVLVVTAVFADRRGSVKATN
jgi:hypothetical protein